LTTIPFLFIICPIARASQASRVKPAVCLLRVKRNDDMAGDVHGTEQLRGRSHEEGGCVMTDRGEVDGI